jgi:peptide chain release factor 1
MRRYDAIMEEMKSTGYTPSHLIQELASLQEVVQLYQQRQNYISEEQSYLDLLQEASGGGGADGSAGSDVDGELQHECRTELQRIQHAQLYTEDQIVQAILPKEEEDLHHDAILEIRAGTGGDEAALFARELWDAYIQTIQNMNKCAAASWKLEILTESSTDLGGIKEGSLLISGTSTAIQLQNISTSSSSNSSSSSSTSKKTGNGASSDTITHTNRNPTEGTATTTATTTEANTTVQLGPYGFLKFESGVHRVQRIPINASRIHTSACSIAVLPSVSQFHTTTNKAELLPMSELKIETMRAHGAGGQHINTTDSAVRITHLPTGLQASIQDERSQHKNKAKALQLITARVRDVRRIALEQELGQARSQLMGGGDRSERIRTYNFPQDRITDHRCKISFHGIETLLKSGGSGSSSGSSHTTHPDGLVISFLPYLQLMRREELLQQLEEEKEK